MAQETTLCLVIRTSLIPEPYTRTKNFKRSSNTDLEDDLTMQEIPMRVPAELSYKHQCKAVQSIVKILMQGPPEEDFNRISTRAFDKDLYKIMQGPPGGFHHDLCKSFSQGIHKRSWNSQAGSCTDTETRSMHICVRFRVRRHTLDRARASQKSSPGALKDFHKTATRLYFCQG